MTPELISLLSQIPIVAFFGYFVLTIMQRHSASAKENHGEWREWFREDRNARQEFAKEQNLLIIASVERMNERITALEARRAEERAEMLVALRAINDSTEHLSTAIEKMIISQPRANAPQ